MAIKLISENNACLKHLKVFCFEDILEDISSIERPSISFDIPSGHPRLRSPWGDEVRTWVMCSSFHRQPSPWQ